MTFGSGSSTEGIRSGSGGDPEQIHSDFLSLWLAQRDHMSGRGSAPNPLPICSWSCDVSEPIRAWSAPEISKFLTFDSNSTSGFDESDVLKMLLQGYCSYVNTGILCNGPFFCTVAEYDQLSFNYWPLIKERVKTVGRGGGGDDVPPPRHRNVTPAIPARMGDFLLTA